MGNLDLPDTDLLGAAQYAKRQGRRWAVDFDAVDDWRRLKLNHWYKEERYAQHVFEGVKKLLHKNGVRKIHIDDLLKEMTDDKR